MHAQGDKESSPLQQAPQLPQLGLIPPPPAVPLWRRYGWMPPVLAGTVSGVVLCAILAVVWFGGGWVQASTLRAEQPGGLSSAVPRSAATLAKLEAQDALDSTPSRYYVWDNITAPYTGPRDPQGVVMIRLGAKRPLAYNPTATGEWAIHFYENWLYTGSQADLADFLVQARWLRDHMDSSGRFAYGYAHVDRGIKAPWHSAMAQGIGTSVLLRAWETTKKHSFLAAAKRAVEPFSKNVADGGVVTEGGKWLEEYPDSHHVLNGSMFAAFGLYDMIRVTRDPEATRVWTTFTRNLADNLYQYENNGSILYELRPGAVAQPRYFDLHLRQLRALALLTGDERFAMTADRWSKSLHAVPDPTIKVALDPPLASRPTTVVGTVLFEYEKYDGPEAHVVITPLGSGSKALPVVVPVRRGSTDATGSFTWNPPASDDAVSYAFGLAEPTETPDIDYDYVKHAQATITIPASTRR